MKKARMNISHSRFILFKLKIFGEIVTSTTLTFYLNSPESASLRSTECGESSLAYRYGTGTCLLWSVWIFTVIKVAYLII